MTERDRINDLYFKWLCDLVCGRRYSKQVSFKKLLIRLYNTEFTYIMPKDKSRAENGVYLRYRFSLRENCSEAQDYLLGPCSILEMMIALSLDCEESIMTDTRLGDRTGQWFWGMIVSLGLGSMTDNRYDEEYVEAVLTRFLERDYEPDGKGGLFTIRNCKYDLREVEIFCQLCWYLDTVH